MAQSWNGWCWQLRVVSSLALFGLSTSFGNRALAQSNITPDNTLGEENSVVLPNVNGTSDEVLTGGAERGANLFHSFLEFNVSQGRRAYFYSPSAGIQNILARVTGGNSSRIMGLLGTYGESQPNLFLINPNGIMFGPNATLDVGGSFVASTARSLLFADGNSFSATAPQSTPLLTVSVPIGLQFGGTAGGVVLQGASLSVQPSKTLALVGGNLGLEDGSLNTEGGHVELGSVAGNSLIRLNPTTKGWALGYEDAENFQDIQLSQQAVIDVSGEGGGDIQVRGKRVTLTDTSSIYANTRSQNGGGISIQALELQVLDGAQISASTFGAGQGGNLDVTADSVKLSGSGTSADGQFASGLLTSAEDTGSAGNLKIATRELQVLDGAQISASTFGAGQGGNLDVTADSVKLSGSGTSADGQFASGLLTSAEDTGSAGNLKIATRELQVLDGAQISASTFGAGQAGNLDVTADSVKLSGTSADSEFSSGLFATTNNVIDTAGNLKIATGDAGNLKITTRQLQVLDGAQISAAALSNGQGGNLNVTASDFVELSGTSANGEFFSSLSSQTVGPGAAGDLTVVTGKLNVRDRAQVSVSSEGLGDAGDLDITARSITLDNQAILSARSKFGRAGNIKLQARDLLLMRNRSLISASSVGSGDDGNITIDNTGILVALEDSDIMADSSTGPGANVRINAIGRFFSPDSEVTASGSTNIEGTLEVENPNVLPEEIVDVTGLIAQGCSANGGQAASKFIVTGRGGLPPTPREALSSDTVLEDWGTLALAPAESLSREQRDAIENRFGGSAVSNNPTPPASAPIVEAQGWVIGANGEVMLTAQAPNATPHNPWLTPANCHT